MMTMFEITLVKHPPHTLRTTIGTSTRENQFFGIFFSLSGFSLTKTRHGSDLDSRRSQLAEVKMSSAHQARKNGGRRNVQLLVLVGVAAAGGREIRHRRIAKLLPRLLVSVESRVLRHRKNVCPSLINAVAVWRGLLRTL